MYVSLTWIVLIRNLTDPPTAQLEQQRIGTSKSKQDAVNQIRNNNLTRTEIELSNPYVWIYADISTQHFAAKY